MSRGTAFNNTGRTEGIYRDSGAGQLSAEAGGTGDGTEDKEEEALCTWPATASGKEAWE